MKYAAALALIGFLGIISFGFLPMDNSHHSAMASVTPCPIAELLHIVCTPDKVPMASVHLSALYSFLNSTVPSDMTLFAFFFIIGCIVFIFGSYGVYFGKSGFYIWNRLLPRKIFHALDKIKAWLSLFEHSPSFA